jgi:hypothetical protein
MSRNKKHFIRNLSTRRTEMKKIVIGTLLTAVALVAMGTTGLVSAKSLQSQGSPTGNGSSNATMGSGRMGEGYGLFAEEDSLIHDEMIAIYAEKLGISVEDLQTRLDAGETMADIAVLEGLTITEFHTLQEEVRAEAIALAVDEGTMTQDQADWMTSHTTGYRYGGNSNGGNLNGGNSNGGRMGGGLMDGSCLD